MICFAGSAELPHDEKGFSLPSRRGAEGAISPGKTNEKGGSCKDWREVHREGRPPFHALVGHLLRQHASQFPPLNKGGANMNKRKEN